MNQFNEINSLSDNRLGTLTDFNFLLVSRTGRGHMQIQKDNEDFCAVGQEGDYLAIALTDGVSTCPCSKSGAQLSAAVAVETLLTYPEIFLSYRSKDAALNYVLRKIEEILRYEAEIRRSEVSDYSAGIACVLMNRTSCQALVLSRGNIMVGANHAGHFHLLVPVENDKDGIYTVADEGAEWRFAKRYTLPLQTRLFMLSDGAWKSLCQDHKIWNTFISSELSEQLLEDVIKKLNPWDDCTCGILEI